MIAEAIKAEDQQKAAMAAAYELSKLQDRSRGHGGRGSPHLISHSSGNPNQGSGGWQMATCGKNSRNLNSFEADKMKISGSSQVRKVCLMF